MYHDQALIPIKTLDFYNDKEKYVIDINHFKNDQLILKKGSFFKLNYDLNNANINLVTSIHKDAAINYLQNTILSRETRTDRVSSFLQQNLNENNDITLTFNIDHTSNNIIESLKNLYFASSGAHPGAGIPGVLSSAKVVENIILNE